MSSLAALAAGGILQEGVPLGPLTTYKVGGPARWFLEVDSERRLLDLAEALAADPAPVIVLGRGSNVLISDGGFDGVVVHLGAGAAGLEISEDGVALAGAGLPQPALARGTGALGRGGLEYMIGIPGSVGGAVRMNSGSLGSQTADWLITARIVDLAAGTATDRDPEELGLRYRHSRIAPTDVVLSARFRTIPRPREECEETMRDITRWRRENQPGGTFNAGSVFKNPDEAPAGQIIDELGLKGLRSGGASVSERHANFIVADLGTTAADVYSLICEVRDRVEAETGIVLEPEMRLFGEFEEAR